MDLMYMIILWLKKFVERMANITSFVGETFLPDFDYDDIGLTGIKSTGKK